LFIFQPRRCSYSRRVRLCASWLACTLDRSERARHVDSKLSLTTLASQTLLDNLRVLYLRVATVSRPAYGGLTVASAGKGFMHPSWHLFLYISALAATAGEAAYTECSDIELSPLLPLRLLWLGTCGRGRRKRRSVLRACGHPGLAGERTTLREDSESECCRCELICSQVQLLFSYLACSGYVSLLRMESSQAVGEVSRIQLQPTAS
jgi:hypothetical protein